MKIFVAGASGAIGQPLVAELIRKGHTVTGMKRAPPWQESAPSMRRCLRRHYGAPPLRRSSAS